MPRIASRFGSEGKKMFKINLLLIINLLNCLSLKGISFSPYSKEQLQVLIKSRLGNSNFFHEDAISFCAMSVASSFGDARRALNLAKLVNFEKKKLIFIHYFNN